MPATGPILKPRRQSREDDSGDPGVQEHPQGGTPRDEPTALRARLATAAT